MTMHDYHPGLTGYDERQIWHDGCTECERRGENIPYSVTLLDRTNMKRAYERAKMWASDDPNTGPISHAEAPLLRFFEVLIMVNEVLELEDV